jgi:hypothetical protein
MIEEFGVHRGSGTSTPKTVSWLCVCPTTASKHNVYCVRLLLSWGSYFYAPSLSQVTTVTLCMLILVCILAASVLWRSSLPHCCLRIATQIDVGQTCRPITSIPGLPQSTASTLRLPVPVMRALQGRQVSSGLQHLSLLWLAVASCQPSHCYACPLSYLSTPSTV